MAGFVNISEVLLNTENLIAKRPLKILTTRQKILVMQVSKFSDCGLEFACFGIKKDSLAFSAIGKFVEDHFQLLDSDKSDQRCFVEDFYAASNIQLWNSSNISQILIFS